ncbi:MAG: LAGLIDADG family homing endonuclease [Candidatus Brockarchaeota archaeon]|nr:LAGLIDADG family homing endonuclease [Candidatus Brockarchaeota archaeon]
MGGGTRVGQWKERFFEGEIEYEGAFEEGAELQCREDENEVSNIIASFGEYEARGTDEGYELLKGEEVIGIFKESIIQDDRIFFELSRGVYLEVSEGGIREILTSEKAELCGLIASDGGFYMNENYHHYRVYLSSADEEVAKHYEELFEKTYHKRPHRYRYEPPSIPHYSEEIEDRSIYFDLWNLGIKGSMPYEFHVPKEHLDLKGARAYLRGFFTGDGGVAMEYDRTQNRTRFNIRFDSKYKEGLEEIRGLLRDLGFHPLEIHEYHREDRTYYYFRIPEGEHLKFIEEIGSEKPNHQERFEFMKQIYEEKRRKKERED